MCTYVNWKPLSENATVDAYLKQVHDRSRDANDGLPAGWVCEGRQLIGGVHPPMNVALRCPEGRLHVFSVPNPRAQAIAAKPGTVPVAALYEGRPSQSSLTSDQTYGNRVSGFAGYDIDANAHQF